MKKGLFAICLSLVVAIVLLAAFVPSCTPTTGTIEVNATSCGVSWTGNVSYTLTPASGSAINGNNVTATFSGVATGTWTCAYVSGGPGGAYFLQSITPLATQSVSGGGKTTFTLNFELKQDAGILWSTWTVNGNPIPGSAWQGEVCQIIDAHFQQWVDGCTGYNVTLNETSWLSITQTGGLPGVVIYVVDDPGAVNKTPAARQKVSQVPSFDGHPALKGANITLILMGPPAMLDVRTVWQLVKGTNYTKAINWFGISKSAQGEPVPHPGVLFELVLPPGPVQQYTFTLQTSAEVTLVGYTDVNPANNSTGWSPALFLTVIG